MPKQVSIEKLKEIIGEENTKKLYDSFAGMNIYIPKKGIEFPKQTEKEQCIMNLFYSGVKFEEIAQKFNLSRDRVTKIIYKNYHNKNKQK